MPLFGFDEYKQYAGPVNWGSTLGKWIINKERAPYSRKPCIGFHCESTDPFLDWYGNKEAGYAGESF